MAVKRPLQSRSGLDGAGQVITSVADPTAASDAATRGWALANFVAAADTYWMPPPTGVAATDQTALNAAFASGKRTIVFAYAGTYEKNTPIAWPTGVALLGMLPKGAITIRESAASTQNWMFTCVTDAAGIGASFITFDANKSNRSGQYCGLFDFYARAKNTQWDSCQFNNTGESGITLANSENHKFLQCDWLNSQGVNVVISGVSGAIFDGCTFYNYNSLAGGIEYPSISIQLFTGTNRRCVGLNFSNCRWTNVSSTHFAVESVLDIGGRVFHEAKFIGNEFYGNYIGGIGISGTFGRSIISGNQFFEGMQNNHGGLEIAGDYNVVSGNYFQANSASTTLSLGAVVAITKHHYSGVCKGNQVFGNAIEITQSVTNNNGKYSGIALYDQEGVLVAGNTVTISVGPSITNRMESGIYVGTFGSSGAIIGAKVCNNIVVSNNNTDGSGIRVLTAAGTGASAGSNYGTDIEIYDNQTRGMYSGITLPSTANDTHCAVFNNKIRGTTLVINGTMTGTGCVVSSTYPY